MPRRLKRKPTKEPTTIAHPASFSSGVGFTLTTIMETYALDFETYYDKHCSIKTLGTLGYFSHPEFDAYMISIVGDNGYSFVGHPKDFDWDRLNGAIVLSHNASFDETLYLYGVTQNWWPQVKPHAWHCTADMAAACGLPRSLKNASAQAFNLEVSKETRNLMSGKRWETMSADFQKEVSDYALKDSELCLRLWQEYAPKWSEFEQNISRMNRNVVQRGLPIDTDLLEENLGKVRKALFEAEQNIPWHGEKPLLSRKAFDEECIRIGIEPPASLAATCVEAQEWLRINGSKYKWIEAVINWRRINAVLSKLEAFDAATMPDGRYYGGIMYFGGHTGRFSGSGGNLNLQNLPRNEMFGANLRSMIAAPAGKKLVAADLSNIEVRTLCWLAGDAETLTEIATTEDIYEAFAIRFGLWAKEKGALKSDPALRHKVKALVLGCGYGAGAAKFAEMYNMPFEEASDAVELYRTKLHKIPSYWQKLNNDLKASYSIGSPYQIKLASGRSLSYGKLKATRDSSNRTQYVAIMNRNGKRLPMKLWGGILAENASQAMARDILCHMMLELEKVGINVILHIHDEIVAECDEADAEEVLKTMNRIMSTPPEWCSDLPLAAEGYIGQFYKK
jgi:DNA polymerase I-like protein with 3'-5' exonuclease and polymerase domains